jgi:hypothetical protein
MVGRAGRQNMISGVRGMLVADITDTQGLKEVLVERNGFTLDLCITEHLL